MDDAPLTVGAFEAKTHLSALLERVAQDEEVLITRHGKAIARLVPAVPIDRGRADRAIARLKEMRRGATLGDLDWTALRDHGRR